MLAVPVAPSHEEEVEHPDGGTRAWVVIFGTTLSMAATYGLMTGVGLFQVYWKENQLKEYSATDIAWIISIFGFLTILLAGPAGFLFDLWGARRLLFPAAAVYFMAFLGLAFSSKFEQFMGCFIVAGASAGKWFICPVSRPWRALTVRSSSYAVTNNSTTSLPTKQLSSRRFPPPLSIIGFFDERA